MRIVLDTPHGNVGRVLTLELLRRGTTVIGLTRNFARSRDLVERGLRVIEGSLDQRPALEQAFKDADAIFWLTPPAYRPDFKQWAGNAARLAADVAREQRLTRAVVLSSIGAQAEPGAGPVAALRPVEEAFFARLPHVTVLRAGMFMENLLRDVPTIARDGAIYSPLPTDRPLPWVAARDVAIRASQLLLDQSWRGQRIVGVHGPADLNLRDIARQLSEVLGRPVRHVQVSLEQAREAMLAAGAPDHVTDLIVDMYRGLIDGRLVPAEPRTPDTTTPTTLAEFTEAALRPALEAILR